MASTRLVVRHGGRRRWPTPHRGALVELVWPGGALGDAVREALPHVIDEEPNSCADSVEFSALQAPIVVRAVLHLQQLAW